MPDDITPLITLEQAADHLKIQIGDDDDRVQQALDGAISAAQDFLDRELPWLDCNGDPVAVPKAVISGILLIMAKLYDNRAAPESLLSTDSAEFHLLYRHRRLGV